MGTPYSGFSYHTNLVGGQAIHSDYRAQALAASKGLWDPEKPEFVHETKRGVTIPAKDLGYSGRNHKSITIANGKPVINNPHQFQNNSVWHPQRDPVIKTHPLGNNSSSSRTYGNRTPWANLTYPNKPWTNLTYPNKPWTNLTPPVQVKFGNYSVANMDPEYKKNWDAARRQYEIYQKIWAREIREEDAYKYFQYSDDVPLFPVKWVVDAGHYLGDKFFRYQISSFTGIYSDSEWAKWYNTKSNHPPPDNWSYKDHYIYRSYPVDL